MLVVRGRTRTGRDHRLLPWLLPGYRRQTWKLFVKYSAFEIQYVVVLEVIEAGWGLGLVSAASSWTPVLVCRPLKSKFL